MIRVCCCIGTWQLVTLAAALQQIGEDLKAKSGGDAGGFDDYLVVYETGGVPNSFKETVQQMAEIIWPWKRIVWAYDLLTSERRISQKRFDLLRQTLRERVGVPANRVDEIWVCWLTRPAEKLVFETYPSARIQLFEDGLISYIPVPLAHEMEGAGSLKTRIRERLDKLRPVRRYRRSHWALDPRHLSRVESAYLQLTPDAPAPEILAHIPRRFVEYRLLHQALERVKPILAASYLADSAAEEIVPDRLLVLGQALSRNGMMSRDEELGIYGDIIDTLLAKGYRVLWKEHPRIHEPFFADLKTHLQNRAPGAEERLRELSLPRAFPIELAADRLGLAGCVAGTSAALFYLRRLYGIPCYTFGDVLLPYMQGVDIFMNDMIRREVPPLSELPSRVSASETTNFARDKSAA